MPLTIEQIDEIKETIEDSYSDENRHSEENYNLLNLSGEYSLGEDLTDEAFSYIEKFLKDKLDEAKSKGRASSSVDKQYTIV